MDDVENPGKVHTLLRIKDFSYAYPGTDRQVLRGVSLSLERGECVCVAGPSGCGKTTLLLAAAGLLEGRNSSGFVSLSLKEGLEPAAGVVFQNAESQILCSTVEDEAAFGPENMGLEPHAVKVRVRNALAAVGLAGFEKRNVEALSAGEKHRLSIASVLTISPALLVLDEPTGQIDLQGKEDLLGIIRELKRSGHSILVADHDYYRFSSVADRFLFMEDGRIVETLYELPESRKSLPQTLVTKEESAQSAMVEIEGLFLTGRSGDPLLRGVELKISAGERLYLFGSNGAGKSSLLLCMAGFLQPDAGRVSIAGVLDPKPEQLLGAAGFLFQNPDRQLFEETVQEEAAFSLKRLGCSPASVCERVAEALALCEVAHLADRSPLTLSYGEKHRVALASVLATRPEVLLLDEPFSGLDFMQRRRLLSILREAGTAVLIASHDPLPDDRWADRSVVLEQGVISPNPLS